MPITMSATPKAKMASPFAQFFKQDARHFQIVYLSIFLIYGIFWLDWAGQHFEGLYRYGLIIGVCLLAQAIGIRLTTKDFRGLKSALITALGLCLLCKANSSWTLILAASTAIGGKYLIRFKGKHVFNPANMGIIMAILISGAINLWTTGRFLPDAWVSPGQWGSDVIMLFVLGALGSIVLLRVGRLDTSLAFIGTFALLVILRNMVYLGETDWRIPFHTLTNGSLLLFTFFMITDPVTTPNAKWARIGWAVAIAVISFALTIDAFHLNVRVHAAPIYTLFALAPITALLDRYFKGKRFSWYEKGSKF